MDSDSATASPFSILHVDDDESHLEIVRRNLEDAGLAPADVINVRDGQAALDYLRGEGPFTERTRPPDLVLLDLRLPKVDGLEVIGRVKGDARLRKIPVVVLSTSSVGRDIGEAYARGANSYLVKPTSFREFAGLLGALNEYWLRHNRYAT